MSEYIERGAVLRHKRKMSGTDFGGDFWDEAVLCEEIWKIPAADVVEVKHGRWIERGDADYQCSVCGFRFTSYDKISEFPYCRCGCKMDGKGEGK